MYTVPILLDFHTRHPVPFTAHISPSTDEFSIHPTTGELPTIDTQGSLICVSYRPLVYGKSHTAKAVIQVSQPLLFKKDFGCFGNLHNHAYSNVINVHYFVCSHPVTPGVMTLLANLLHILPLGLVHPPTR